MDEKDYRAGGREGLQGWWTRRITGLVDEKDYRAGGREGLQGWWTRRITGLVDEKDYRAMFVITQLDGDLTRRFTSTRESTTTPVTPC